MFNKLGDLRAHTQVPFMALTATASESTAKAICDSLHLRDPVVVSRSLNRRNIFFSVGKSLGLKVSSVVETFTICISECTSPLFRKIWVALHQNSALTMQTASRRPSYLSRQRPLLAKCFPF